jgi:hypothetical protein
MYRQRLGSLPVYVLLDLKGRHARSILAHGSLAQMCPKCPQGQLREGQRRIEAAKDDAATAVSRAQDAAARDVRDAEARARSRLNTEHAELLGQLAAEQAAVAEERALLERNRATIDTLSTLSARVEVVTAAAVDREERLVRRIDGELIERERRCSPNSPPLSVLTSAPSVYWELPSFAVVATLRHTNMACVGSHRRSPPGTIAGTVPSHSGLCSV